MQLSTGYSKDAYEIVNFLIVCLFVTTGYAETDPKITYAVHKLEPKVRAYEAGSPKPTVEMKAIQSLLDQRVLIDDPARLKTMPSIVAFTQPHLMISVDDQFYTKKGLALANKQYLIIHPSTIYRDATNQRILGYEMRHVGYAQVDDPGNKQQPARLSVTYATGEIRLGDYLMPMQTHTPYREQLTLQVPSDPIRGYIIDVIGALRFFGGVS